MQYLEAGWFRFIDIRKQLTESDGMVWNRMELSRSRDGLLGLSLQALSDPVVLLLLNQDGPIQQLMKDVFFLKRESKSLTWMEDAKGGLKPSKEGWKKGYSFI